MPHCISRLFEPLLRLLLPAPGRHRSPEATPAPHSTAPRAAVPPPLVAPRAAVPLLRGEDAPLVRPYLLAHERGREEARRRRARRRALWLAVHGIDLGPRVIHGVEVTA